MQRLYEEERLANEQARASFMKLLHECQVLRQRFEECNINFINENEDDLVMDHVSCSDALDLLTTYDNQINFLLSEVWKLQFSFLHLKTVATFYWDFSAKWLMSCNFVIAVYAVEMACKALCISSSYMTFSFYHVGKYDRPNRGR